jgi:hypothetical protein
MRLASSQGAISRTRLTTLLGHLCMDDRNISFEQLVDLAARSIQLRLWKSVGYCPDPEAKQGIDRSHPYFILNRNVRKDMDQLSWKDYKSGLDLRRSPFWPLLEHRDKYEEKFAAEDEDDQDDDVGDWRGYSDEDANLESESVETGEMQPGPVRGELRITRIGKPFGEFPEGICVYFETTGEPVHKEEIDAALEDVELGGRANLFHDPSTRKGSYATVDEDPSVKVGQVIPIRALPWLDQSAAMKNTQPR